MVKTFPKQPARSDLMRHFGKSYPEFLYGVHVPYGMKDDNEYDSLKL